MAVRQHEQRQGTWQSFADVAGPSRPATPSEAQAVADVIDLTRRYAVVDVTLAEIRAASSGKQRFWAVAFTSTDDPSYQSLMRMIDALVGSEDGLFPSKHGAFDRTDMEATDAKIVREDGRERLCFPVGYWRSQMGGRGGPIYRHETERRPRYGSFGVGVMGTDDKPREREWWEAGVDDGNG